MRKTFLVLMLMLLVPFPGQGEELPPVPQLSVSGDAELKVAADQVRFSAGVTTEAETVKAALQENNTRMQAVRRALLKAGLTEKEMETGQFRVEPRWSPPPRQPAPGWRPQIVGYTVVNSLDIRTTRLEQTGELIAAATGAGANDIGSLTFDLADPRRHRAEAIRQAAAHAREDARALAEAAGVRLVRIVSLHLDQAAAEPLHMARMASFEKADAAAPVIAPGEVTVRAAVRVVYEIVTEDAGMRDEGRGNR